MSGGLLSYLLENASQKSLFNHILAFNILQGKKNFITYNNIGTIIIWTKHGPSNIGWRWNLYLYTKEFPVQILAKVLETCISIVLW